MHSADHRPQRLMFEERYGRYNVLDVRDSLSTIRGGLMECLQRCTRDGLAEGQTQAVIQLTKVVATGSLPPLDPLVRKARKYNLS